MLLQRIVLLVLSTFYLANKTAIKLSGKTLYLHVFQELDIPIKKYKEIKSEVFPGVTYCEQFLADLLPTQTAQNQARNACQCWLYFQSSFKAQSF